MTRFFRSPPRGARTPFAVALSVLVSCLLLTPAAVGEPAESLQDERSHRHYVALGDSFTAGPLIPFPRLDPLGCFRSTRNYPSVLRASLAVDSFTDASCSGATTVDLHEPQSVLAGRNAPQLDALRPDTDLVTLQIGGNDIGFSDIVLTCAARSVTAPNGNPCERHYTRDGGNELAERIEATAPLIDRALAEITRRSPLATVLVVGYQTIVPSTEGCFPRVPIARGDTAFLDGVHQALNAMLATAADRAGAAYVDTYSASQGHDWCQPKGVKWVEGVLPTSPAFPVHPNELGMAAVADMIEAELSARATDRATVPMLG
ncbi:SGNH/GDSL hydrolase family protein [Actinoalloteichus spitiensis]|uniref:SGNH/GDSL hydrolase family protein n=1 Tax=Actinoalloteichus spitiensis TaxID=252394 RepID=UPI0003718152|nr:SGNH/GDSL hydrolase family protein [Actinoalloteichus spitiensis]